MFSCALRNTRKFFRGLYDIVFGSEKCSGLLRDEVEVHKNAKRKKKQNKTEQNRTEQNRTEQNRTEQNRTEQNRTEQNRTSVISNDIDRTSLINKGFIIIVTKILYRRISLLHEQDGYSRAGKLARPILFNHLTASPLAL